ncbi:MAG: VOC family protein [Dehalococcoidia bacterium]
MDLRRLDHVVLAVRDLRAGAGAWAGILGLRPEPPFTPEGSHMQLAALPLSGDSAFIELVQPTTPGHRVAVHLDQVGEGMFSISLHVGDLAAAVAELKEKGVPVSGPERGALPNTRVARIPRDAAHGVAIQLIERW